MALYNNAFYQHYIIIIIIIVIIIVVVVDVVRISIYKLPKEMYKDTVYRKQYNETYCPFMYVYLLHPTIAINPPNLSASNLHRQHAIIQQSLYISLHRQHGVIPHNLYNY